MVAILLSMAQDQRRCGDVIDDIAPGCLDLDWCLDRVYIGVTVSRFKLVSIPCLYRCHGVPALYGVILDE